MIPRPRILIIDDEVPIQRLLRIGLGAHGFAVVPARNGEEGLARLEKDNFDAVILDLGLPDRTGFEVLEQIRRTSAIPLIVLSVRGDEQGKVKALELGADDYVTKPFGMAELVARIRVAIKHRFQVQGTVPALRIGDIEIDLVHHRVSKEGKEILLTPIEYDILALMVQHAGKVLTHDQILKAVRGGERMGDYQYLRVYIRALRAKLGDTIGPKSHIRTETGIGYRFVPPAPAEEPTESP